MDRQETKIVAENTVASTALVVLALVLILGIGAWLFSRLDVPSLQDASKFPTTQPLPKDPRTTVVPKSNEGLTLPN